MNEKPPLYTVDVRPFLERLGKPRVVPESGSKLTVSFTDPAYKPRFTKKGLWRTASMFAILVPEKLDDGKN